MGWNPVPGPAAWRDQKNTNPTGNYLEQEEPWAGEDYISAARAARSDFRWG